MTTTILARFVDGKLFIQESKLAIGTGSAGIYNEGVPVRVGHIGHIDKVISVGNSLAKLGLLSPLDQVMSASLAIPMVRLFRGDAGDGQVMVSGVPWSLSGNASLGLMSAITSGLPFAGEVAVSTRISGLLTLTVNVIGY
jgi:hypothetical protein